MVNELSRPRPYHAGKRIDRYAFEQITAIYRDIRRVNPSEFLLGGIIGKANIVDCVKGHAPIAR